jgi:hypothetical protein
MNLCVSGHENPTGAVYCVTCGKDLSLQASVSGRQCTLGHPMLSHEETCTLCGNLPLQEKVELDASSSSTNKSGIIAKLELSDMQSDAKETLRKFRNKLKINLKILLLVLILLIAIPSAFYGYSIYAGPNYKGKTVEEVLKNREDQINAVLQPACSVGTREISAAETVITSATETIFADYTYALGYGVSTPSVGDVRREIRDEVEKQLKSALGDGYLKLDNASAVISSGEESAIAFCGLNGALTGLREKSTALEQTVNDINSPGSWAPSDFYYDDEDPNIANKWGANPPLGWSVIVMSRLGCPAGVKVTLDATYGYYTGYSGAISPGGQVRVKVYSNYSFYVAETAYISSVTCS